MEGALVGGAVAEGGHGHLVRSLVLGGKACAGHDGDAATDDAVGAHDPLGEVGQVHRSGAAHAVAVLAAEQLGHGALEFDPLRDGVAVAPVGRPDVVVIPQVGAYPDGCRFLPDADVEEAQDFACGEYLHELFFSPADAQHLPVEIDHFFFARFPHFDLLSLWDLADFLK